MTRKTLLDLVTETDYFGDRWVKDYLMLVPPRWWPDDITRPRLIVHGLWGESRCYATPPKIMLIGCGHAWTLYLPSRRYTPGFRVRHYP